MKNLKNAFATAGPIALAVVLLASGSALAQDWGGAAFAPDEDAPAPGQMGKKGGGHGPHMIFKALQVLADEIGLSQAQKDDIQEIIQDSRDEIAPLREKASGLHVEMMTLMKAKKLDKKKIKAKHAEIQAVSMEISEKRLDMMLDVMDVLSNDQRVELFSIVDECKAKKGTGQCKAMFKKMKNKKGKGPGKKGKGPGKNGKGGTGSSW